MESGSRCRLDVDLDKNHTFISSCGGDRSGYSVEVDKGAIYNPALFLEVGR